MQIEFASVCSGIEAASVAFSALGWEAAWLAEIEPFPSEVLDYHYFGTPNHGDMTKLPALIRAGLVSAPPVFCGGTPCQSFSVAGTRRSLSDDRGNLSLVFCDIADAIDEVRIDSGEEECVIFWENVPGVLNTKDNAFGCFLAQLAGEEEPLVPTGKKWTNAGAVFGPKRAIAWRVLDAQYFGLAQQRRRVFVVASARDGFDPLAVLFEREGERRDSPPSREAGQETAAGAGAGTGGSSIPGTARCLTAGAAQRFDSETETMIPVIAHTLRGEGFDASEDGTGRGTPLVPVVAGTLKANNGGGGWSNSADYAAAGYMVPVSVALRGRNGGATAEVGDELAFALRSSDGGGDKPYVLAPVAFDTAQTPSAANYSNHKPGDPCHPLAAGAHPPAIAFHPTQDPISSTDGTTHAMGCGSKGGAATVAVAVAVDCYNGSVAGEAAAAMGSSGPQVMRGAAVRRLTPRECERLQGFQWLCSPSLPGAWQDEAGRWWSPDYTAIPWRNKPASECPDGPRYKALGNSWAVPVVRWIGKRIQTQLELCEALK